MALHQALGRQPLHRRRAVRVERTVIARGKDCAFTVGFERAASEGRCAALAERLDRVAGRPATGAAEARAQVTA